MALVIADFSTTLSASISDSVLLIPVTSVDSFPVLNTGDTINITLEDAQGNREIIEVNGLTGNDLIVEQRGFAGTTPLAFPAGSLAESRDDPTTIRTFIRQEIGETTQGSGQTAQQVRDLIVAGVKAPAQAGNAAKWQVNRDLQDLTTLNSVGPGDVTDADDMIIVDKTPSTEVKRMSFGAAKDKMTEDISDWAMEGNTDQIPSSKLPATSDDQTAAEVSVSTTNFGGNLTTSANTVQKALDEVDNLTIGSGGTTTGRTEAQVNQQIDNRVDSFARTNSTDKIPATHLDKPANELVRATLDRTADDLLINDDSASEIKGLPIAELQNAIVESYSQPGTTSQVPQARLAGAVIKAVLEALGGTNRLNASAIQGLPEGTTLRTAAETRDLLYTLTANNRLDASRLLNRPLTQSEINGLITAALNSGGYETAAGVTALISAAVSNWAQTALTNKIPNSAFGTKLQEIINAFEGGGYENAGHITTHRATPWTIQNIDTAGYMQVRQFTSRFTNVYIGLRIPLAEKANLSEYRLVISDDLTGENQYHTEYPSSGWTFLEDDSAYSYYQQQVANIPLGDYVGIQRKTQFRLKPEDIELPSAGLRVLRHGPITGRNIPNTSNNYRTAFQAIAGLDLDDITSGQISFRIQYNISGESNTALGFDDQGEKNYSESDIAFPEELAALDVYNQSATEIDGELVDTATVVIGAATQGELKLYLVRNAANEVSPIVEYEGQAGSNNFTLGIPDFTVDVIQTNLPTGGGNGGTTQTLNRTDYSSTFTPSKAATAITTGGTVMIDLAAGTIESGHGLTVANNEITVARAGVYHVNLSIDMGFETTPPLSNAGGGRIFSVVELMHTPSGGTATVLNDTLLTAYARQPDNHTGTTVGPDVYHALLSGTFKLGAGDKLQIAVKGEFIQPTDANTGTTTNLKVISADSLMRITSSEFSLS